MSLAIFFILLSFVIFAAYNIFILIAVGIPENISITYYYLNRKRTRLGLFFPLMMILLCLTIRPAWSCIDNVVGSDIPFRNCLIDITLIALLVVAVIANYKRSRCLFVIHYASAIVAVVASLLWIILADWRLFYIPVTVVCLVTWAAWLTRSLPSKILFWLEITNIYSIQIVLFLLAVMLEK